MVPTVKRMERIQGFAPITSELSVIRVSCCMFLSAKSEWVNIAIFGD